MSYRHSIGYLTTTAQDIYHAKVSRSTIASVVVCNTSGANTSYSIWHVPADEDQNDVHALFYETAIKAKNTQVIEVPIVLDVGDKITALAAAGSAVVLTLYVED